MKSGFHEVAPKTVQHLNHSKIIKNTQFIDKKGAINVRKQSASSKAVQALLGTKFKGARSTKINS
jgi:hypothetical protein